MKTHIFTTFDKKTYQINAKENEMLSRMGDKEFFVTQTGAQIRGSSINAIMPIEDYYKQNPELRPPSRNLLEYKEPVSLDSQAEKNEKRYRGLLAGMALYAEEKGIKIEDLERRKKKFYQLFGKDFELDQSDRLRVRKALNQ